MSHRLMYCWPGWRLQQPSGMADTWGRDLNQPDWAPQDTENQIYMRLAIAHRKQIPTWLKTHHCQVFHFFTNWLVKEVLCEKLVNSWCCQIKGEHFEHQMFHSQHLLLGVSVICDVNKLCHLRRVDLLKFPVIKHVASLQECTKQAWKTKLQEKLYTYEASSMAAVPTSWSFPLKTDIEERKRSM